MSSTPQQLLGYLDELQITYQRYEHPAVFTVAEAQQHCSHIPGAHCKNLFLRAKKWAYWLVVLRNDAVLNLDQLGTTLGAGRFSFASAERLDEILGVIPGAVTPFALINDRERKVQVALDERLLSSTLLTFHPLINTATLTLTPSDLMRFFNSMDYKAQYLAL